MDRAGWIGFDGNQTEFARCANQVADRCRPWVEEFSGRPWVSTAVTDAYLARIWACINYHGSRFAGQDRLELQPVLDRLEQGELGYERPQSNILRDVCFAEALQQRENRAAELFERDLMPKLKRMAQRLTGLRGIEMVDNFLAELILPREASPPRLASYLGKTSLISWLKAVVSNFCHGRGRVRTMSQLAEEADPVAPMSHSIEADSKGCADLLRPLFSEVVATVPVEDRLLLKFLVLEDVPQKDVARMLGIHSGNVTRRRQRATERIWEQFQAQATQSQKASPIRGCLELVLAGDDRELQMTLGNTLAAALPSERFPDEREGS